MSQPVRNIVILTGAGISAESGIPTLPELARSFALAKDSALAAAPASGHAAPKAAVDINRMPPSLEQTQAQLRVFRDAPLRPTADVNKRRLAHHRHRAVLNDRVVFVPLHQEQKQHGGDRGRGWPRGAAG